MATLDRARFERLYLNANILAEIAFLRGLDAATAAPAATPTADQRAAAAALVQQLNNPDPATFDWDALKGVYGFDGPLDAPPAEGAAPASVSALAPPEALSFDAVVGWDDDEDLDAPPDLARYLARVEQARPALQARIDDCYARADLPALEAALATLPAERPPLTSALDAAALEAWLALYERHDAGLEAAVLGVRRLEPLFAA